MLSRYTRPGLYTGAQMAVGGLGYGLLEILCRGYTHISMILVGGICFVAMVRISKSSLTFAAQCLTGALFITAMEFAAGWLVNLRMGLGVWDYSQEPLHLYGQICPKFTILWCALCAVVLPLCRLARRFPASLAQSRPCPADAAGRLHNLPK